MKVRLPRVALPLALLLCAIASPASTGPFKDLSVADALKPWLFGRPLPRHVQWAPDGRTFYYMEPGKEGRPSDLMAYDLATGRKSVILSQGAFAQSFAALAGKKEGVKPTDFSDYALSPKGDCLLVTAFGGLCLWDLKAGKLSLLLASEGETPELTWSPDGANVAFSEKGDLWVLDRRTGARTCAAKGKPPLVTCGEPDWLYSEEVDLKTALWWSPDSTRIAYLRFDETGVPTYPLVDVADVHPEVEAQFYPRPGDRNPGVTLEIADLRSAGASPVKVAVSGDGYVARVTWLPDGGSVAYELLDREQKKLGLYVYGLSEASSHLVLEESAKTWVDVPGEPRFLKESRRFLWLSERDGYTHLYLCSTDGAPPFQLTKGHWIIDSLLGVDEARGVAYIEGNRENPLGKQTYRVDLRGGTIELLTDGNGWHEADLSPTCAHYLDTCSRAGVPGILYLTDTAANKRVPVEDAPCPALDEYGMGKPEFITLKAADGTPLYASVLKPRDFDPNKRYPAVVEVYGGPALQMVQDRWVPRWAPIYQLFSQAGFVCFSVDNRGSARRGKAFSDALFKRMGQNELEDQLAGLEALKKLPYVDGERVGIWGWSYGGFMTLYALTHAPNGAYRCGAAVAPVSDWLTYDTCYTERYLKLPSENPDGYRDSSPVTSAASLSGALFMAQGLSDDNVHFTNSARMAEALCAARKPFEMAYYPRMGHGIAGKDARADVFTRLLAFFEIELKGPVAP
jgi:dipeptidyl-peptidase 4